MHAKSLSTTTGLSEISRRHSTSPPWPAIISSWFGGDAFAFFSQDFSGPASGPVRGLCVHFPDTASSPGSVPPLEFPFSGPLVCAIVLHRSIRGCGFFTKKLPYSIVTAPAAHFGGGSND